MSISRVLLAWSDLSAMYMANSSSPQATVSKLSTQGAVAGAEPGLRVEHNGVSLHRHGDSTISAGSVLRAAQQIDVDLASDIAGGAGRQRDSTDTSGLSNISGDSYDVGLLHRDGVVITPDRVCLVGNVCGGILGDGQRAGVVQGRDPGVQLGRGVVA